MDPEVLEAVVVAALISVGTICVLNVLGIIGSKYGPPGYKLVFKRPRFAASKALNVASLVSTRSLEPLFSKAMLRNLSIMCSNLLIPCLSFTRVGSKLSLETMGVAWPAFIWSPINVAIAFGAGVIMTKIVRPAANMRRELVVACTFSNGVALPLVLVEVLSSLSVVEDEEPDALEKSQTFIFAYSVLLTILIWGVGHTYLDGDEEAEHRNIEEEEVDTGDVKYDPGSDGSVAMILVETPSPSTSGTSDGALTVRTSFATSMEKSNVSWRKMMYDVIVEKALKKPSVFMTLLGMFVGLITPLRRALFTPASPLKFVVAGLEVVGSAGVGGTTLVMVSFQGLRFATIVRYGGSTAELSPVGILVAHRRETSTSGRDYG